MNEHAIHDEHEHVHEQGCGHPAVRHEDHTDFLHDGHLHHPHDGHYDEHSVAVSDSNPSACTPDHSCGGHDASHIHGPECGHPQVPHGDHSDYLVGGHLHFPHDGHCDDHGRLEAA